MGELVVITGLDGSGTSSLAQALCERDPRGLLFKTPGGAFQDTRAAFDGDLREASPAAHYLFYLASVVYASGEIRRHLSSHNIYCVRYLIDTVVSHRAAGLDVDLQYENVGYSILKPDVTLFVEIDEAVRQERLEKRGKSLLDRTLDDPKTRAAALREFARFESSFHRIDNSSPDLRIAVDSAMSRLPWLSSPA